MGVLLLVRHGQASFGAANYDQLSLLGERQGRVLGEAWAAAGFAPTHLISGSMARQHGTARAISAAVEWPSDVVIDPRWNEFDHVQLVDASLDSPLPTDPLEFQRVLDLGMRAWANGDLDHHEPFTTFSDRVEEVSDGVISAVRPGGSAVVVTSSGVISWLASQLLGGGVEQWIRFNRVAVNSAVTKIVSGKQGASLVSYNEHSHLTRQALSYR